MARIPEIRVLNILTQSGYRSFQSDAGAGWSDVVVGPAVPGNTTWLDIFTLDHSSAAGYPHDCEEAIETTHAAGFTFSYNSTGALRGKFTWAKDAGTFKIRPNGDGLLDMMGFTDPSAVAAASHDANIQCHYIYTSAGIKKGSDTWNYEILGSDHESMEANGVISTVGPTGIMQVISPLTEIKKFPITLTCVPSSDLPWLDRLWRLIRTGRPFRYYQDRTVLTAYDDETNRLGYVDLQLVGDSLTRFATQKTYPQTEGWVDVTFNCQVYVAPP